MKTKRIIASLKHFRYVKLREALRNEQFTRYHGKQKDQYAQTFELMIQSQPML